MPSRDIACLNPTLQETCKLHLEKMQERGLHAIVVCTYRSGEEQNKEYARGRTVSSGIGVRPWRPLGVTVTKARAGQSPHNCMLNGKPAAKAYDIALFDGKTYINNAKHPHWIIAGQIGEELGLRWGAAWGDSPHFEMLEFSTH